MSVQKKLVCLGVIIISIMSIISLGSAITATILEGGRIVLRLEPGESAERSLLLKNSDDIPTSVDLSPVGDLAAYVKLDDDSFVLQPGEERRVKFTIKAAKSGTTETKINVMFSHSDGAGAAIPATIIVITGTVDEDEEEIANNEEQNMNEEQNTEENNTTGVSFRPGGSIRNVDNNSTSTNNIDIKLDNASLLYILTGILLIVFLALYLYSRKLKNKGRELTKSGKGVTNYYE